MPTDQCAANLRPAVELLVNYLPPLERACVLLKDIFDYSLEEIAAMVESTTGGVKSALNRGRSKLANVSEPVRRKQPSNERSIELLHLYVERFNRHDWDGVRELITADARLRITNLFAGKLGNAYFSNFERLPFPWQLVVGEVDGESVILLLGGLTIEPKPNALIRFDVVQGHIKRIRHYTRCPWVLEAAHSIIFDDCH